MGEWVGGYKSSITDCLNTKKKTFSPQNLFFFSNQPPSCSGCPSCMKHLMMTPSTSVLYKQVCFYVQKSNKLNIICNQNSLAFLSVRESFKFSQKNYLNLSALFLPFSPQTMIVVNVSSHVHKIFNTFGQGLAVFGMTFTPHP